MNRLTPRNLRAWNLRKRISNWWTCWTNIRQRGWIIRRGRIWAKITSKRNHVKCRTWISLNSDCIFVRCNHTSYDEIQSKRNWRYCNRIYLRNWIRQIFKEILEQNFKWRNRVFTSSAISICILCADFKLKFQWF